VWKYEQQSLASSEPQLAVSRFADMTTHSSPCLPAKASIKVVRHFNGDGRCDSRGRRASHRGKFLSGDANLPQS
jgi:hypothetical protein